MTSTGRFYLCQRCRLQVIICRRCDHGQIYCSNNCSNAARCEALRASGRRYQQSSKGRFKHAARARHYRQRRNKVTHQGSSATAQDDLLAANSVPDHEQHEVKPLSTRKTEVHCHFCGAICSKFVRRNFLHRHRVPNIAQLDRRGTQHDHSP